MTTPSSEDRKALRRIGFWMNRTNDAWSMGEANWAKGPNGDLLSKIANDFLVVDDYAEALRAVEHICKSHGIDPERHRWHGKG